MLIRQTLQYLPAQIVGPLSQFVAVLAWTHWLPPSDFGFITLLFALQELTFTLCLSWWALYTMRYLPGLADREAYERSETAIVAVSSLAQLPVILAALALTGHLDGPVLVAAVLAFTLSRSVNMMLAERARALGDVLTYTIAQTAGPVLGFALGAALQQVWPAALAVVAGFALVQVAILPVLAARSPSRHRASLRIDRDLVRAAFLYGGPLLAASGFNWVSLNGIRLVVERLDGLVVLGILSVGWNLGQRVIGVVGTMVTAAAFPLAMRHAAARGPAAGIAQINRAAVLSFALMLPAIVGLIQISGPFTSLFVGPEFQDATRIVLPLAAVAAALRNLRVHTADQVFLVLERPGFVLGLNAVEAVVTVVLCAAGLMWGGLAGACVGTLAATAATAFAGFAVAHLRHGFGIPLGTVLRFGAAVLVMAAVVRLDVYPAGLWGLGLQVAAGGLVYLGLAVLLLRNVLAAEPGEGGGALDLPAPAQPNALP